MDPAAYRILLIADSTIDPLARFVGRGESGVAVSVAPYDQVVPTLAGDLAGVDLAVVFTQPDRVSAELGRALACEPFDRDRALAEFAGFADLLRQAAGKVPMVAAYTWTPPHWAVSPGPLGWGGPQGVQRILAEANLKLAEAAERSRNLVVLDSAEAIAAAGAPPFDPKLWAMGKVIHSRPMLEALAGQIRGLADAVRGRTRKLILLDLDDTLWGGIVGEDGWQDLRLGGIDPIGESYAIFQRQLKALRNRGVLLGIVSKNDEATAMEAIRRRPEMVLGVEDFVGWRINWRDKAANIVELVEELNLGLQSVVFIDDNPAERDRVRQALPEVLVPDWPMDPAAYPAALKALHCFDVVRLSDEDRGRTAMYRQERRRSEALATCGSREQWLRSLQVRVRVRPLDEGNLPRAAQLLNKTNQFNLAARRHAAASLADWAGQRDHAVLTFDVADRFGEYGLVGLLGLCVQPDGTLRIVDWVVSCRVLGRGLEEAMLAAAGSQARRAGCGRIVATYLPTAKNRPILAFLEGPAAARRCGDDFQWSPDACPPPVHVAISDESEEQEGRHVADRNS